MSNPIWRMVIWIAGLAVAAALGNIVGTLFAPRPDQVYLFRSAGAVVGVCLFAWLMLKLFGAPGPNTPADKR